MPDQLIPAAGLDAVGAGEWKTLTIAIPDKLKSVRKAINTAAELLIAFLELIKTALELIKAFLVGYLDPITAIVRAILAELQKLIHDIQQLGFYFTSDYKLLVYPFDQLRGGFTEYERRMVAKLTDRTDFTRPDLSSLTPTIGIFFYLSVDVTAIERLIRYIQMLMRFFGQAFNAPTSLPVPTIKDVVYGSPGTDIISVDNWTSLVESFQPSTDDQTALQANAQVPNVARISWTISPPTLGEPFLSFPSPPPGGFLVTVSTIRAGIKLVYDRPRPEAATEPSQANSSKKVQPREHGDVQYANAPLVLYGGKDMLGLDPRLYFNYGVNGDGTLRDGFCRVYGVPGAGAAEIIPLDFLKDGDQYYFQRTFWVGSSETLFEWMTSNFTTEFALKKMPLHAEVQINNGKAELVNKRVPYTYYVRVASSSSAAVDSPFRYLLAEADVRGQGMPVIAKNPDGLSAASISNFSEPFTVTFPNANTAEFLKALQTALAVLILTRADLTPLDMVTGLPAGDAEALRAGKKFQEGIALDATGLEPFRYLLERIYTTPAKDFAEQGVTPSAFRSKLARKARSLAIDIYQRMGAMPDVEAQIVQNTVRLRTATWGTLLGAAGESSLKIAVDDTATTDAQKTILGSLLVDSSDAGLALNPFSADLDEDAVQRLFSIPGAIRLRKPGFLEEITGFDTDMSFKPETVIPAATAASMVALAAPGLRMVYEKFRRRDGSIVLPSKVTDYLFQVSIMGRTDGSADMSPILFSKNVDGAHTLADLYPGPGATQAIVQSGAGMVYVRSVLLDPANRDILTQAALALGITSSLKKKGGGEWYVYRFFDSLPALEDFFQSLYNWIKAINDAVKSIADAIRELIEFFEARITEIQQFIKKINDLLQTLLSLIPLLPAGSGLILVSSGTGGLLGDFVSAKNKPSDSPLAYGAGCAIVAAVVPGIDLLGLLFNSGDSGVPNAVPPFGIEDIPPEPLPAPDAEPDVL